MRKDSDLIFLCWATCLCMIMGFLNGCTQKDHSNEIPSSVTVMNNVKISYSSLFIDSKINRIIDVTFSPDGRQIGIADEGRYLRLFTMNDHGRYTEDYHVEKVGIQHISWSPVESLIAISYDDGTIETWDVKEKKRLAIQELCAKSGTKPEWSSDGSRIALTIPVGSLDSRMCKNMVEIYDSHRLTLIDEINHTEESSDTFTLSWNQDSNKLNMVVTDRSTFYYIDGTSISSLKEQVLLPPFFSLWVKDHEFLLISNDRLTLSDEENRDVTISLFDGLNLVTEYIVANEPIHKGDYIGSAVYLADQKLLATYSWGKRLAFYWILGNEIIDAGNYEVSDMNWYVTVLKDPTGTGFYIFDDQTIKHVNIESE